MRLKADNAIAEGQKRLAMARAAEADRADQAEARELAEQLETACGEEIDRALEILVTAPRNMQRALQKMHDLGAPRPDHRQFSILSFPLPSQRNMEHA